MSAALNHDHNKFNSGYQKTIALDFDGVMNTYDGWKGEDELFEPRPGLTAFLKVLQREGNQIVIFTNRPVEKVNTWLEKYGVDSFIAYVTNTKPLAHVYVDDRAVTFEGNFYNTYMQIAGFRTHWEADKQRMELNPNLPSIEDDKYFAEQCLLSLNALASDLIQETK